MRSSALLQAAYAVCRFLMQEQQLSTLVQGVCDRIVGPDTYQSALIVVRSNEAPGGMITAETGFGELGKQISPLMAALRMGRLPQCANQVLQSDANKARLCTEGACQFCATDRIQLPVQSICVPLRCHALLSGFMIVQLFPGVDFLPEEDVRMTELAEAVSGAFRQFFVQMQEQELVAVQQRLHEAVALERNFLQTVIDSAGDPVMVIDLNFNLLLINQAAAQLVRSNDAITHLQGQKCYHLFCSTDVPCHDRRFPCPVVAIQRQQRQTRLIHSSYHGNSIKNIFELEVSPLCNSQGELYGIIEVARDVTDRLRIEKELRDSQRRLYRLAHHDTLTGLPNRLLFRDRLTQAISKAERNRTGVAVLFLDLDRFKQINDTLGHDVGDDLLIEVADRLQRQCRQSDTVARIGGDEFVFVLEDVASRQDAALVAKKIMATVTQPICVKGHELHITTSIGIALFPDDSIDLDGVIKCADIALYAAKERGRSNFQMYRQCLAQRAVDAVRPLW